MEENIILLTDEDGTEYRFELLDRIALLDREYVVLVPADDDTDEVQILEVEDYNGKDSFVPAENNEIIETVFELFKERNSENFDFS